MTTQETWTGRITYCNAADVQNGVEHFSITKLPSGITSLNATCEIWDDALVRQCLLTLDAADQPINACVQTFEHGLLLGSATYRFEPNQAMCSWPGAAAQSALDYRIEFFGTHALINDGWLAKALPADRSEAFLKRMATCSHQPNGGGAPGLLATSAHLARGPKTQIDLGFHTFDVLHYSVRYGDFPPLDMWVCVQTGILVRLTWDYTGDCFQLEALAQSKAEESDNRPS
ncbi:MAG: hypothetical protein AAF607_13080 [Pseudomonadota bacterium]